MGHDNPKSGLLKYAIGFTACTVIVCGALTAAFMSSDIFFDTTLTNVTKLYNSNNDASIQVRRNTEANEGTAQDEANAGSSGVYIPGSSGSLAVDTSAFYTSQQINSGSYVSSVGDIPLYNGWPWGDTSNITFVNIDGLFEDLTGKIASTVGTDVSAVRRYSNWTANTDKYCATTLQADAGVSCLPICFYPSWVDQTYYAKQLNGEIPAWTAAMASSVHACILLNNSAGQSFLVPIVQSDNKGHTYPGGVVQTFMKAVSTNPDGTVNVQCANKIMGPSGALGTSGGGAFAYNSGKIGVGDGAVWTSTPSGFLQLFNESSGYSLYYQGDLCSLHKSFEVNAKFQSSLQSILSNFTVVGILTQPK